MGTLSSRIHRAAEKNQVSNLPFYVYAYYVSTSRYILSTVKGTENENFGNPVV